MFLHLPCVGSALRRQRRRAARHVLYGYIAHVPLMYVGLSGAPCALARDETSLLAGCSSGTVPPVPSHRPTPHPASRTRRGHSICRTSILAPAQDLFSPNPPTPPAQLTIPMVPGTRTYASYPKHHVQTILLCFSRLTNRPRSSASRSYPGQADPITRRSYLPSSPSFAIPRVELPSTKQSPPCPITITITQGHPPSNNNARHHPTPSR